MIKLTMRRLKTVIREMALEKSFPPLDYVDPDGPVRSTSNPDRDKVRSFFKQSSYEPRLKKLFQLLSTPIYVVPIYDHRSLERVRTINGSNEVRLKVLLKNGLDEESVNELRSKLEGGASVFIVRAAQIDENFWPTPWMCIHALFDTDNPLPGIKTIYEKVEAVVEPLFSDVSDDLIACLTMKSARSGALNGQGLNDVIAEILTQATVTSAGFTPKESEDTRIHEALQRVKALTANARTVVDADIAGNAIDIFVSPGY